MTITKKALTDVRIKDAEQGVVELVFATFNKVDKDGDVTLKGAFTQGASVVLSAYGHKSWDGELPYGTGVISESATEAIAEVKFELDAAHARDAFTIVKALSAKGLQEWSYSLEEVESERGTVDGKSVRILKKITVKEVSPVLRGAGTDTRTLSAKAESVKQLASMVARMLNEAGQTRWETGYGYVYLDDFDLDANTAVFCIIDYSMGERERYLLQVDFTRTDTSVELGETETQVESTTQYLPKGAKFSEHSDFALRGVKSLVEMAVERLTLRAAEGKTISEQTEAYDRLCAELVPLKNAIDHTTQPADTTDALDIEWLRFVAASRGVNP
jgi:hypothetical protein